jgi:hypothetical protein
MRNAFTKACQRSPECRSAGRRFLPTLRRVLDQVRRRPWEGTAYDADGRRVEARVDGPGLAAVAFGATYTPAFYRELTAALRSGLRGYREPLLRLVAEAEGGGTYAGPANEYSEGLDAAVACHDYPQLYNMKAPPARRERQYDRALADRARTQPRTYAPFTVREYAESDWQMLDWCTRWPVAAKDNPAGPIRPPVGYPDVPVLVLSGELDSITTAAEGQLVKSQFPDARHVLIRNSFHVTALSDRDNCAERIVRAFVRAPGSERSVEGCADDVEPVRALGTMPRRLGDLSVPRAAALTVTDVMDRWWNNYDGSGVGLHGGTFSYTGNDVVKLRLKRYRLFADLAVSGNATWDRDRERVRVHLTLSGAERGRLHGGWDTRAVGAKVAMSGAIGGLPVYIIPFPAP